MTKGSKKRILVGPFVGELGWELTRFQAYIRCWYNRRADKGDLQPVICTFRGREILYQGVPAKFIHHPIELIGRLKRPSCYGASGLPKQVYGVYKDRLKHEHNCEAVIHPPLRCSWDWIGRRPQQFIIYEAGKLVMRFLDVMLPTDKDIILLFPRRYRDKRDWGAERWFKLVDLLKSEDFFVVLTGVQESSVRRIPSEKNVLNLIEFLSENIMLEAAIGVMNRAICSVGGQSALPILSMLQRCPTFMWGHEKVRHTEDNNFFRTSCDFIDGGYQHSVRKVHAKLMKFLSDCPPVEKEIPKIVGEEIQISAQPPRM